MTQNSHFKIMKHTLAIIAASAATVGAVSAVTILPASSITGHHQGDSAAGNGSTLTVINGSGITQTGGATNPSTWTHNDSWTTDWQGDVLSGASNSKVGWTVIDLGSVQSQLGEMLVWNVNEASWTSRGTETFNIYYATAPTTTAPGVSATPIDYDFASGGWTQLGGTRTLLQADASAANALDGTYDLSSISSAQYIGIEMLTSFGNGARVGLGEVVFTEVPEPSSTALLGLGCLALMWRRRK